MTNKKLAKNAQINDLFTSPPPLTVIIIKWLFLSQMLHDEVHLVKTISHLYLSRLSEWIDEHTLKLKPCAPVTVVFIPCPALGESVLFTTGDNWRHTNLVRGPPHYLPEFKHVKCDDLYVKQHQGLIYNR
jgi:hypothetical protein